jgi:hypothetical protein
VPFGALDFIDPDGVDLAERPVFVTPGDDMFDRVEDLVPGCAKTRNRWQRFRIVISSMARTGVAATPLA